MARGKSGSESRRGGSKIKKATEASMRKQHAAKWNPGMSTPF